MIVSDSVKQRLLEFAKQKGYRSVNQFLETWLGVYPDGIKRTLKTCSSQKRDAGDGIRRTASKRRGATGRDGYFLLPDKPCTYLNHTNRKHLYAELAAEGVPKNF